MGTMPRAPDAKQLQGPADILPSRGRFTPTVAILIGRRNAGKTYSMTALAKLAQARYREFQVGCTCQDKLEMCGHFKVASNYWTDFSEYYSPYIMDLITEYPPWAENLYLCIDEIQTAALSRRSMSKQSVNITQFLSMIRKRRISCIMTTQFPQVLDQQLLMQVDFVIEVETRFDNRLILAHTHDYWQQWSGWGYGSGQRKSRYMPPPRSEEDWVKPFQVPNPYAIYNSYDTDEVIAPTYLGEDMRAALAEREIEGKGRTHRVPAWGWDEGAESEGPEAEAETVGPIEAILAEMPTTSDFQFRQFLAESGLAPHAGRRELAARGYVVDGQWVRKE